MFKWCDWLSNIEKNIKALRAPKKINIFLKKSKY